METAQYGPDQGIKAVATDWCLLIVSILLLSARLYAATFIEGDRVTRKCNWRRLTWDDYFMVAATTIQIGHAASLTVAWHLGMGRHIWTLDTPTRIHAIEAMTVVKGFSVVPSTLGRISVALYQLRLLRMATWSWKNTILVLVLIAQPLINLIALVEIYSQCGLHVSALWNPAVKEVATCLSPDVETNLGYAQSGVNSLCDLILSLFPIIILWSLQLPLKKKIQVYALLSTSYFAFAASVVKTVEIGELSASTDFTWNFATLQVWVCIEINTILITGNFPATIPLIKLLWKQVHTTTAESQPTRRSTTVPVHRSARRLSRTHSSADSQELAILKVSEYNVKVAEVAEKPSSGMGDNVWHKDPW